MRMLDLFSGRGGASAPFLLRGWDVVTVDVDPAFNPSLVADLSTWHWGGGAVDFVWASPPCTEFAREDMPWSRTGKPPDLSLMLAAVRIIHEVRPRFWVVENVRGAVRWFAPVLGAPVLIARPYFLWGNIPPVKVVRSWRRKSSYSSKDRARRAEIPFSLSCSIEEVVSGQMVMWEWGAA